MKKIMIVFIVFLAAINISYIIKADLIDNYQEITLENPKHRLLSQYSNKELEKLYPKVNKRMFLGWRTYEITKSSKANFTKSTLLSIRNTGTTPITKDQTTKVEKVQKYAVNGSGGVESSASGTIKGFKLGLSNKLNIKADATITISQVETMSTKIIIDPMTQLDVYIMGNGRITNGVASYYLFWIRTRTGGYEYMNITSIFYRMEKKRI